MKTGRCYKFIAIVFILFAAKLGVGQDIKKVTIYHIPFHIKIRAGITSETIKDRCEYKTIHNDFEPDEFDLVMSIVDSCSVFSEGAEVIEFVRAYVKIKFKRHKPMEFYCTEEQFLYQNKVYNASKEFRDMFPLLWNYE